MKNLLKLVKLIKGTYLRLFLIAVFSLLFAAVNAAWPIVIRWIVDNAPRLIANKDLSQITQFVAVLFAALAVLALLMSFFDGISWWLTDRTFNFVFTRLNIIIFKRSQEISHDYYDSTSAGKIQEKIGAGLNGFVGWIMQVSQNLLEPGGVMLFALIIITKTSTLTGLLVIGSLVFYYFDFKRANKKSKAPRKANRKINEEMYGYMSEAFSHFATIRSLSAENLISSRVNQKANQALTLNNQLTNIWASSITRRLIVSRLVFFGSICIMLFQLWQGKTTTGDIVMVTLYITQIQSNILYFSRFLVNTAENETKAERLMEFLEDAPTMPDTPGAIPLKQLESLEFRNVSFTYPDGKKGAIENISFRIDGSHSIALVGPSGVGKSTITKLMLRFYTPTSGEILINNKPADSFTHASIRRHIGMVMQDVALFNTTVKENLKLADAKASQADLITAAEQAHADEFIDNLPKQYNTIVGERGVKLSGGQKQRIAIARAILKNPDLIILDEATSALDSESEKNVQDGLKRLMRGRLSLTIAHRLSTVRHADEILVLKKGTIAERGTHAELIQKKTGLYHRLFELQSATGQVKL
ncbi:MAG: ABC transporter ATP-binding protein [Candidatus Saccharibacteria bacterium]